jgi:uncharacterized protein YbaP (TraB family)
MQVKKIVEVREKNKITKMMKEYSLLVCNLKHRTPWQANILIILPKCWYLALHEGEGLDQI